MFNKKIISNLILVIVVIATLFFAYRQFIAPDDTEETASEGLSPVGFLASPGQAESRDEFLQILLSLRSLEFKTDIFPILTNLRDFSTVLPSQTPGRANPFAEINPAERSVIVTNDEPETETGPDTPLPPPPPPSPSPSPSPLPRDLLDLL